MKKFVISLVVFAFIVGALFLALNTLYSIHMINFGTMSDKKNDNTYIEDVPNEIQICNFGNSHAYYAFNYLEYTEDCVCFNFALSMQSLSYDYRIMENFRDNISEGALVLICLSQDSFYGMPDTQRPEFEAKNKRYYRFLEPQYIKDYNASVDFFVNKLPAMTSMSVKDLLFTFLGLNEETDLWSGVMDEKTAESHGIIRYRYLVEKNVDSHGNRLENREEINSVYQMIELCRELGATPVLLTIPYLAEYTDAIKENDPDFFTDFYGVVDQIRADTNVEFYDYTFDSRFTGAYQLFLNTDHLNRTGAQLFTDIVMDEVVANVLQGSTLSGSSAAA